MAYLLLFIFPFQNTMKTVYLFSGSYTITFFLQFITVQPCSHFSP